MVQGTVVPFVSPSRLFIRGFVAICPSLRFLTDALPEDGSPTRLECERVLELLMRKLPYMPGEPVRAFTESRWNDVLARCSNHEVAAFATRAIADLAALLRQPASTVSRPAAS